MGSNEEVLKALLALMAAFETIDGRLEKLDAKVEEVKAQLQLHFQPSPVPKKRHIAVGMDTEVSPEVRSRFEEFNGRK